MADISKIKLPNNDVYDIRDHSKLPKTTYEYNTELAFGSTGKLLIGKFQCYDSNVTITIQSTTNITYYAVAILATQNIDTAGGGTFTWNTYGDTSNTVTPNLYAKYASGSNWIEIYFSPSSWSKNLIHIQANALRSEPTNICESVSEIPSSATRKPTNTFGTSPKFTDTTYTFANGTNGFTVTPSGGSAQTVTVTPSITNNVTGSGTSGYLTKFNGANTITNGPQLGSDTTKYLRNDGTWAVPAGGGSSTLAGLSDVTITSAANNQKLAYNSTSSKWVNVSDVWEGTQAQYNALSSKDPNVEYFITDAPSTQTFTLAGLQDTSISQLSSGQFLKYDGGVWKNAYLDSSSLDDLTDVSLSSPSSNQFLKFNGTSWINSSLAAVATSGSFADLSNKPGVSALTDTTITSAANDQVLTYRNGNWINKSHIWEGTQAQYNALATHDPNVTYYITDAGEGTAERLNDLEDIDIVNPQNGQLLLYNSNNQTWENSGQYTDFDIRDMDARNITAEQVTTDNVVSDAATIGSVNLPHRYSTEEHIVGYWIDGQPIYEKTLQYDSVQSVASGGNITVPSTMWSQKAMPLDIVLYTTLNATKICWRFVTAQINDSGVLQLFNGRAATLSLDTFTIQYVKL